jgi:hypothetical protein
MVKEERNTVIIKIPRGLIPNRVSTEKRQNIVEKNGRFGDIKVYLLMRKKHNPAFQVNLDRATLLTTIDKFY